MEDDGMLLVKHSLLSTAQLVVGPATCPHPAHHARDSARWVRRASGIRWLMLVASRRVQSIRRPCKALQHGGQG